MSEPGKKESWNLRHKKAVYRAFNDDLMIVLAAVLAGVVILQIFFEFSPGMRTIFEYLNYFIIAAFVAEYCLKLYVDESRSSFITDPLHVLDLIIILLALSDLTGYFQYCQIKLNCRRYYDCSVYCPVRS